MSLSIDTLRSRIWYRLLKTLWVGAFILAALLILALSIGDNKAREVVDYDRTEVLCVEPIAPDIEGCAFGKLYPQTRVFSRRPLEGTQVYLSRSDFDDVCPDRYLMDRLRPLCPGPPDVLVLPALKTVGGVQDIVLWTLAGWLPLLLFFELGRRLFYYIVLGTWRPTPEAGATPLPTTEPVDSLAQSQPSREPDPLDDDEFIESEMRKFDAFEEQSREAAKEGDRGALLVALVEALNCASAAVRNLDRQWKRAWADPPDSPDVMRSITTLVLEELVENGRHKTPPLIALVRTALVACNILESVAGREERTELTMPTGEEYSKLIEAERAVRSGAAAIAHHHVAVDTAMLHLGHAWARYVEVQRSSDDPGAVADALRELALAGREASATVQVAVAILLWG